MLENPSFFHTSALREFYLGCAGIVLAISLEIVGILVYRSIQFRKSTKMTWKIYIAFALLFFGYLAGLLTVSILRFFLPDASEILHKALYFLTWILIGLGGFGGCLLIEHTYQEIFRTYYVFSSVACISTGITLYAWNHLERPFFSYSGLILFSFINVFVFIFLLFLYRHSTKELRYYLRMIGIGYLLFMGNLLSSHNAFSSLILSDFIGILLFVSQIIGGLFMFYGFLRIPTFNDADWRENLLELYIIEPVSKQTLFYHNFQHPSAKHTDIFASLFLGIETVLDMISVNQDHRPIDQIEQENSQLLILSKNRFTAVLNVRFAYLIHRDLLQKVLDLFAEDYPTGLALTAQQPLSMPLYSQFYPRLLKIIE